MALGNSHPKAITLIYLVSIKDIAIPSGIAMITARVASIRYLESSCKASFRVEKPIAHAGASWLLRNSLIEIIVLKIARPEITKVSTDKVFVTVNVLSKILRDAAFTDS